MSTMMAVATVGHISLPQPMQRLLMLVCQFIGMPQAGQKREFLSQ